MLGQQAYQDGSLAPRPGARTDRARPETVANDLHPAGDVVSTGTAQILGHVEGDIRADRIVVAETAIVDGVLVARTVHVDGSVNGPIVADRVTLGPTAQVKGNISYETINIAAGASVIGYCLDRTRQDPATADCDATLALPFSKVRARGKPDRRPQPFETRRTAPLGAGSMKAVWRAYQEGRTTG